MTHDIEEALNICSRIIVLTKTPTKIKNTYVIDKKNINEYYESIWKDLKNDNI